MQFWVTLGGIVDNILQLLQPRLGICKILWGSYKMVPWFKCRTYAEPPQGHVAKDAPQARPQATGHERFLFRGGCKGECRVGCRGSCRGGYSSVCRGRCRGGCRGRCRNQCRGKCRGGCRGVQGWPRVQGAGLGAGVGAKVDAKLGAGVGAGACSGWV